MIHDPEKGKENGYGFVLFKSREGLQNSLVEGNEHIIDGFLLECRQTMLREEMKVEEGENESQIGEGPFKAKEFMRDERIKVSKNKPSGSSGEDARSKRGGQKEYSDSSSNLKQNKTFSKSGKSRKSSKKSKSRVSDEDSKITKEAVDFYKMLKIMMKQQGM